MHLPDLVVISRQTRYDTQKPRRVKAKQPQWTLHRSDCPYVKRANTSTLLPAPERPYPGTVACKTCKPSHTPEDPHGQH